MSQENVDALRRLFAQVGDGENPSPLTCRRDSARIARSIGGRLCQGRDL